MTVTAAPKFWSSNSPTACDKAGNVEKRDVQLALECHCMGETMGGLGRGGRGGKRSGDPQNDQAREFSMEALLGDAAGATDHNGPEQRLLRLARTIEAEIIPRLLLANSISRSTDAGGTSELGGYAQERVEEFTRLVLAHDTPAAIAYIEQVRSHGTSLESLFLDLLTPTARYLGELWKADLCNFADVTIGLSRLQQVLRSFSPAFENELEQWQHGRRALLVPARGEQHTFGLFMLEEFFRRSGWDVWGGSTTSTTELVAIVRNEWIDVVGFSLSCDGSLGDLATDIKAVRKASRNRAVGIMVGGPAFVGHPERVGFVGADATAIDGRQAVLLAQQYLAVTSDR